MAVNKTPLSTWCFVTRYSDSSQPASKSELNYELQKTQIEVFIQNQIYKVILNLYIITSNIIRNIYLMLNSFNINITECNETKVVGMLNNCSALNNHNHAFAM